MGAEMAKPEPTPEAAEAALVINATVDRASLAKAVKVLAPLAGGRQTFPSLACLLMEAEPGSARLSYRGLDGGTAMTVDGPGGAGAALIPERALTAFLAGATGEAVTITKGAEASDLTLADGSGFQLDCVPMKAESAIDDPAKKVPHDAPNFALADGVLAHLFALTKPFISKEETRYYLNGVCFEIEDDGHTLRVVATDGHRMGSRTTPLPAKFNRATTDSAPRYIVPAAAVDFLAKHMAAGEVHVQMTAAVAKFVGSGIVHATKLIEGTFPDWRRVVPDYAEAEVVTLDTKDATRFLRAASALRSRRNGIYFSSAAVAITEDGGRPVFKVSNADEGTVQGPIKGTAPATLPKYPRITDRGGRLLERNPTSFGLNGRYLADMLKALGQPTARLHVKDDASPVRITAEGAGLGRHEGDILILMPMRV